MPYKSMTLLQFQTLYPDEETCIQAIFQSKWPRGYICPYCQHNDGYRLAGRRTMQCLLCKRQSSITSRTLFEDSKVSLTAWFWLVFLMSQDKGGISTKRAAALLGMHYTTVWNMMHKIRFAMGNRQENQLLSGLVEIDDAYFGGKSKGKFGRALSNKKQVCVITERLNSKAGDAALVVLSDPSGDTFQSTVESKVEPMTHIRTDGFPTNSVLHEIAGRLNMNTIGKNYSEHGPLENVDRVISLAKRFLIGTYHQYCSRAHLLAFLNEFTFRFNRRYYWCQLFSRTLHACALCPPVLYASF